MAKISLQFEDSFLIQEKEDEYIFLADALKMAKDFSEYVNDPIGKRNEESWYWCASVLGELERRGLLHSFEVIKQAPKEQQAIAKSEKDVVY